MIGLATPASPLALVDAALVAAGTVLLIRERTVGVVLLVAAIAGPAAKRLHRRLV